MAAWQKGSVIVTGVLISPVVLFVGFITAVSLWPLFLLGRFEGNLGKKPLGRDIARAVRDQQKRTELYYEGATQHPA
ncbi:MAG TPA: hypothetical protein VGH28_25475 [Polyangiaceae bacterium]|jgi:hypothetical protein